MTTLQDARRLGAQGFVARIRERDMPAFGRTVDSIREVADDEKASASALASIILQDAALTTKVLKLANSAYFNPSRAHISTVSRALVVLGFDAVANMALSLVLIDALLRGGVRERVVTEMARAFHAAVQARTLAALKADPNPEEVFISALLARVGEMAFWCFGDEAAQSLDSTLSTGVPAEVAEQNVLGYRLRQITLGLVKDWRLGGLLTSVIEQGERGGDREKSVALAHSLARQAEGGWEAPATRQVLDQISKHLDRPLDEILPLITDNAVAAAQAAVNYGAHEAARLIPLPRSGGAVTVQEDEDSSGPNPLLQLKILRDLSMLIAGKPNLNDVLTLALEGIFRGIGMDRALFAMLTPDRQHLVGKAGLGPGADALVRAFQFALDGSPGELVNTVVARQQSFVVANAFEAPVRLERLTRAGGVPPFVIAPIVVHGRTIGAFYADRIKADAVLSEEDATGVLHFVQQASMGFEHVAARGARA
ncbi:MULTISPECIES: HDOD domain-containing protein [Niveibacterium]|uniref:HDOD domain-containing protein n=1 Tax=Niveibacterium microcysteis TaxID=2811415 RepID=A0ABX7M2U4_9RHOO|nr:HDOD domain-containing protein [Niveibacterium microcysteis]QSI76092.1 HDOD domain-containing protein [Niveibacterium microcysteis]